MPIHEKPADREQQNIAGFQLQKFMASLPIGDVQVRPTPEYRREHYDHEVHINGMWVGVCEVKARKTSEGQVQEWGTLVVEVERLQSLKKQFYMKRLSGKGYWSKKVLYLWRCTRDDACFAMDIEDIAAMYKTLEDAPPEMMTDDHGKVQANKKGKLVPIDNMMVFK